MTFYYVLYLPNTFITCGRLVTRSLGKTTSLAIFPPDSTLGFLRIKGPIITPSDEFDVKCAKEAFSMA